MEELRAFVAVADELHFSHAAQRLGVAPATLSQGIRRLEDKLGAVLLERTPRAVSLTAAGAELLPRALDIIERLDEAQAAVTAELGAGTGSLAVGISSNGFAELTEPILAAFRRAHPGVRVVLRDITESQAPVMSGMVDVALVRPPVPEETDPRVHVEEIVGEPRVIFVHARHRVAGAASLPIAELASESFVEVGPGMPRITDFWAATEALGGERPRLGGEASTVAGVLHAVAYLGDVITSIPSVLRFFHVPGIVAVPLTDVAPATMAVYSRRDDPRPLVAEFRATVAEVSRRVVGLVPGAQTIERVAA
jgi:DNA-binding transcriptional LysR family regulator